MIFIYINIFQERKTRLQIKTQCRHFLSKKARFGLGIPILHFPISLVINIVSKLSIYVYPL